MSPFVPEYVSVQVREVLLTYPNGLMLTYFSGAYQKRFGHYLQFVKFGVSNLHELFNHVIGVGIVSRNGTDYVELTNDTLRKNPSPDKVLLGSQDTALNLLSLKSSNII